MAMTRVEKATKNEMMRYLARQGYPTYAKLLQTFDLNFHGKQGFTAAMIPGKRTILINPRIKDRDAYSVMIRHEILHEILLHEKRLLKHLAKSRNIDYDTLDDLPVNDIIHMTEDDFLAIEAEDSERANKIRTKKDLGNELYKDSSFNIAGDFEISNRGYTERDKDILRNLIIDGDIVSGLVTEDSNPEWVNLSIEEMYDKIVSEMNDVQDWINDNKDELDKHLDDEVSETFIDGQFYNGKIVCYNEYGDVLIFTPNVTEILKDDDISNLDYYLDNY